MPQNHAPADPIRSRYQERYRDLKKALESLDYFCKGTVLSRTLKCGRPICPCAHDPASRHGPYFEWTYKVGGKTVHHRLSAPEAKLYGAASSEHRKLKLLLRRMELLSRRALARQAATARRSQKDG